ncbi:hypothetical protein MAM1_0182d07414 [Mucor ambiguus]|uniref:Uncharacterized protein n=1 Tax=Mucor ambiguus TaxID=91626 RepID=A0A0C9MK83_9FUNG|nr:hypothetical protein MAM1_0182d07414 [Mucor ambiguus]
MSRLIESYFTLQHYVKIKANIVANKPKHQPSIMGALSNDDRFQNYHSLSDRKQYHPPSPSSKVKQVSNAIVWCMARSLQEKSHLPLIRPHSVLISTNNATSGVTQLYSVNGNQDGTSENEQTSSFRTAPDSPIYIKY